jgi:hypothetical protein
MPLIRSLINMQTVTSTIETIDSDRVRWAVIGGWLVRWKDPVNAYHVSFVADPNHEWQISSNTNIA